MKKLHDKSNGFTIVAPLSFPRVQYIGNTGRILPLKRKYDRVIGKTFQYLGNHKKKHLFGQMGIKWAARRMHGFTKSRIALDADCGHYSWCVSYYFLRKYFKEV